MVGWLVHLQIMRNRVTVNPVTNHDGKITSYTVNVGKPIAGHYASRSYAEFQASRIRHAFTGRARIERRGNGTGTDSGRGQDQEGD